MTLEESCNASLIHFCGRTKSKLRSGELACWASSHLRCSLSLSSLMAVAAIELAIVYKARQPGLTLHLPEVAPLQSVVTPFAALVRAKDVGERR